MKFVPYANAIVISNLFQGLRLDSTSKIAFGASNEAQSNHVGPGGYRRGDLGLYPLKSRTRSMLTPCMATYDTDRRLAPARWRCRHVRFPFLPKHRGTWRSNGPTTSARRKTDETGTNGPRTSWFTKRGRRPLRLHPFRLLSGPFLGQLLLSERLERLCDLVGLSPSRGGDRQVFSAVFGWHRCPLLLVKSTGLAITLGVPATAWR